VGNDLKEAKERAYKAVEKIHFEGMHYRKGHRRQGSQIPLKTL
jgi:phosphoribosylamine-glycine ligase